MRVLKWMPLLGLLGCAGMAHVQVLEPAEITVKQSVKSLALVDRQSNKHSFKVMYALREGIAAGPRFEVIDNAASQAALTRQAQASGHALSKSAAGAICSDTQATGIVSLEQFIIDDSWDFSSREEEVTESRTVTKTVKGRTVEKEIDVTRDVVIHEATFTVKLDTRWTLYDCDGEALDSHSMVDNGEWTGEGSTRADAKLGTGQPKKLKATFLGTVGRKYRSRISPFTHHVLRLYYRWGSSEIRAGHSRVQEQDWGAAERLWTEAAKDSSKTLKAKAWHNLAVYHEQKGDLETALKYSKRAAKVLDTSWVRSYPDALEDRLKDDERLKKQLGEE